jgi:uroporphyrinogen decarboxylase
MPSCFGTTPDYKRILKVLKGEKPDRVPVYEYFSDPSVQMAAIGETPPGLTLPTGKDPGRDTQTLAQYCLGYDYVTASIGFGFIRSESQQTVDSWGNVRNFLDEHNVAIRDRAAFEAYPWPRPESADFYSIEYNAAHMPEGMGTIANLGGGLMEWGMWLMGAENFCMTIYDDPDLIREVLGRISDQQVAVARNVAAHPDVFAVSLGDDMGFKTQTFLPPDAMREFILPGLRKIAHAIHEHGKPFILHSCGNLTLVMDDLIDYVGVDAKHSFEDVIMPVTEVKARWGDRVALLGGVDVDFLCRSEEKSLRSYVRSIVETCGVGGGFAVGSGNSIANYIPPKALRAMNEEAILCQSV